MLLWMMDSRRIELEQVLADPPLTIPCIDIYIVRCGVWVALHRRRRRRRHYRWTAWWGANALVRVVVVVVVVVAVQDTLVAGLDSYVDALNEPVDLLLHPNHCLYHYHCPEDICTIQAGHGLQSPWTIRRMMIDQGLSTLLERIPSSM